MSYVNCITFVLLVVCFEVSSSNDDFFNEGVDYVVMDQPAVEWEGKIVEFFN